MDYWILILLLVILFLFEFTAAFSFNYKIRMIKGKRYTLASALGGVSTAIFTFSLSITSFVATLSLSGGDEKLWWFILIGAGIMSLGNVIAVLLLKPFENYLDKKKKNKEKNGDKE